MCRRLQNILFIISFYISFSTLNAQASVFEPPPGSKISADSVIAAIERGEAVWIHKCEILGPLIKRGTPERLDTIKNIINISSSNIDDSIFFSDCFFMSPVVFAIATFKGVVNFSQVTFSKQAIFVFCTFKKHALFQASTFCSNTHFYHTTFGGDANFSYSTFSGQVDLGQIEFEDIYISWKQLEDHLIYDTRANLKLMKYFDETRKLDDADGVYLFLKNRERMEKSWYIRYSEYYLIQLTCGYGVKPQNTLYLSIFFILLFAVMYTKTGALRARNQDFALQRSLRTAMRKISFYHALYFSLQTFIIGVVPEWYPTEQYLIKIRKFKLFKFKTLAMIEGALGWILVILFIISLGKKFIR
ncbi:MAG: hypothetical protein AMJ90_09000 [candidate division Zixibacteria bacterium SM23_73_2]|nr:MAG: hypothetical protein AMJ90_09000 [candidate division Zixibacteria bacterium SM23_73_2]